jgi:hypothetical protein
MATAMRRPAKRMNLKGLLERLDELHDNLTEEKGERTAGWGVGEALLCAV